MKNKIAALFLLLLATRIFAVNTNTVAVIPLPQKMELHDGVFQLTAQTRVYVDSSFSHNRKISN